MGLRKGVMREESYEVSGVLQGLTPGEPPASVSTDLSRAGQKEPAAGGEDARGPKGPLSWPQRQVFVI